MKHFLPQAPSISGCVIIGKFDNLLEPFLYITLLISNEGSINLTKFKKVGGAFG